MAVFATTGDPRALARRVVDAVRRGAIASWTVTSGHLLLHNDPRVEGGVAFFVMSVTDGAVKFALAPPKQSPTFDVSAYAYHHARLTEILLGYFSDVVTRVQSTPFPGAIPALI